MNAPIPAWLRTATLDQVDRKYRDGLLDQDHFEAYMHAWRTGAFRYSTLAHGFEDGPHSVLCKHEVSR